MVAFVLDDARVKALDFALDDAPERVEADVVQMAPARHQTAQPGQRKTTFPALFDLVRE